MASKATNTATAVEVLDQPATTALAHVQDQSSSAALMQVISQAALNPAFDMDKVERMVELHEKVVAREAIALFNAAMARAQMKIQPVVHNKINAQTGGSGYANVGQIVKSISPIYGAEGFSVSFNAAPCTTPGYFKIVATLAHAAGHQREYYIEMPLDNAGLRGNDNKTPTHALGSTKTYARRYLICDIWNVPIEEDTDGNKALKEKSKGLEKLQGATGGSTKPAAPTGAEKLAPAGLVPEGYKRIVLKYVDRKSTSGGKPFLSIKGTNNEHFFVWDEQLFDTLESLNGHAVDVLAEPVPAGAPGNARPSVIELRRVEAKA